MPLSMLLWTSFQIHFLYQMYPSNTQWKIFTGSWKLYRAPIGNEIKFTGLLLQLKSVAHVQNLRLALSSRAQEGSVTDNWVFYKEVVPLWGCRSLVEKLLLNVVLDFIIEKSWLIHINSKKCIYGVHGVHGVHSVHSFIVYVLFFCFLCFQSPKVRQNQLFSNNECNNF
jgi:hypothetical protein